VKSIRLIYSLVLFIPLAAASQSFESSNELLHLLNSTYDENFITIHPNGKRLAFARSNYPYNQGGKSDTGDIWMSSFDTAWQVPTDWHQVNSEHFSSPIGWSRNGSTFLYNKVSTKGGALKTEIWAISGNQNEPLDIPYFSNKSAHQSGCISADNRYIIVSIESGSTQGVEDLYVIVREGDKWTAPKNLGSVINTKFQEITPFLSPDMQTLYFATNGREGYGSFDIYSSERLDDTWRNWSTPTNLGAAVNSSGRETSFTYAQGAEFAYFISTRNSDGYGDIRRVKFLNNMPEVAVVADSTFILTPQVIKTFTGLQLINAKSSDPIVGEVTLRVNGNVRSYISNNEGIIPLNNAAMYEVLVTGFMNASVQLESGQLVPVWLEPLEVGRTIRLENVLFKRGSAIMIDVSFEELDGVVDMLKNNPEINIMLKGHTDGNGDKLQNIKLSQERVETVKKYLVSNGISKKRINGIGLGGEEPIASNDTEEARKLNRRVEFEVMK